jgi:uncharacterized protein (DUF2147 family)
MLIKLFGFFLLAFMFSGTIAPDDIESPPVPEGVFLILDDGTQEMRSKVEFYRQGNELRARIKELKEGYENARCEQCTDELKNKKLMGMDLIWGLEWDGSRWSGGEILDVDSGKIYRCRINSIGDNQVEIRGYVGSPIFGETLVWPRAR